MANSICLSERERKRETHKDLSSSLGSLLQARIVLFKPLRKRDFLPRKEGRGKEVGKKRMNYCLRGKLRCGNKDQDDITEWKKRHKKGHVLQLPAEGMIR